MSPKPAKNPHSLPHVTNDGNDHMTSCCLEAILTIDGRGLVVIPKEIRMRANIAAGDKLALISWEREGTVCCLTLLKTETLSPDVSGMMLPMLK
jgi:AbrB family looped-hinge helix DNA binding protein